MDWYKNVLGIQMEKWGASFDWGLDTQGGTSGTTAFNIFKGDSNYYPGQFMVNFRVHKLDEMLTGLRAKGVRMEDMTEDPSFGKFAWVYDPDGNKIELWEPVESAT